MKKIFLLVFIFLLTLQAAFAITLYLDIVSVESTSSKPDTIYPGDTVSLEVALKNNSSTQHITNMQLSLVLGENFIAIDTVYDINKVFPLQTVSSIFKFKVKEDAQPGLYSLPLHMTYVRKDKDVIEQDKVTLTVSEINKLDITDIKLSNPQPHIEEQLTITATVKNIGSQVARDVLVSLEKTDSTTFGDFITLASVKQEIGDIAVEQEEKVIFKIKPGKKITLGIYAFDLIASCLDCAEETKEKISFEVLGKPELILSGIDFSVEGKEEKKIVQGDTFSLSVQLDNIGKEQAKAVEVTIELDNEILGSKKSYIGTIDEDDSGSALFDFTVSAAAPIGKHSAIVTITYIDEVGSIQQFSKEYDLFINQAPPPDLSGIIILLIILLVIAYFFVKMVFRQLAMRKI